MATSDAPVPPGRFSRADPYGDAALEARALKAWTRLALTGGVVSLVLGVILLLWPGETLLVVMALIGIWLIVSGILRLAESVSTPEVSGSARALFAVAGVLYLIVGIVLLRNLPASLAVLAIIIGIVLIAGGISEVIASVTRHISGWGRVGTALAGLLTILAGLVVVFWPGISLAALVWIGGIWLVVLGVVQLVLAVAVGRTARP